MSIPELTPEREQLLGRAVLALAKARFESAEPTSDDINITVNACAQTLYSYSDRTLSLLCDERLDANWAVTVSRGVFTQWDDGMVHDFVSNAEFLQGDAAVSSYAFGKITGCLRALQHYELAPIGKPDRERQTAAILRLTLHLIENGSRELLESMELTNKVDSRSNNVPYIIDNKLRNLLLGAGHNPEAVVDLVIERNIYGGEHIASLLDGVSTPLSSGSL